jgi:hypothetical protein
LAERRIGLVFRTVGERTGQAAYELAIEHIQPDEVHVFENVRPFSEALRRSLQIDYSCDAVVFMDADCLITEDIADVLRSEHRPYVDSVVLDRFRGYVQAGVHLTRIDVVRAMRKVQVRESTQFVVSAEHVVRRAAMHRLGLRHARRPLPILHDFFQFHRDIFAKYVLRELRCRTPYQRLKLAAHHEEWELAGSDADYDVARRAIAYSRRHLPGDADTARTAHFLAGLPRTARLELRRAAVAEKSPLSWARLVQQARTVRPARRRPPEPGKIFGIGLALTGTTRLSAALTRLGFAVLHAPDDWTTLGELRAGQYGLSLLADFDGAVETIAPFFAPLDHEFPTSKFILTVCDVDAWLAVVAARWGSQPVFDPAPGPADDLADRQRWLHERNYGTIRYDPARLARAYTGHIQEVRAYFRDRPGSLLTIDLDSGAGWGELCSFLDVPVPREPFPNRHEQ